MRLYLIILKFLFIGGLFIVSNYNLHLGVANERGMFFDMYGAWLGKIFHQGTQVTGYVTQSHWLPDSLNVTTTVKKK